MYFFKCAKSLVCYPIAGNPKCNNVHTNSKQFGGNAILFLCFLSFFAG